MKNVSNVSVKKSHGCNSAWKAFTTTLLDKSNQCVNTRNKNFRHLIILNICYTEFELLLQLYLANWTIILFLVLEYVLQCWVYFLSVNNLRRGFCE